MEKEVPCRGQQGASKAAGRIDAARAGPETQVGRGGGVDLRGKWSCQTARHQLLDSRQCAAGKIGEPLSARGGKTWLTQEWPRTKVGGENQARLQMQAPLEKQGSWVLEQRS